MILCMRNQKEEAASFVRASVDMLEGLGNPFELVIVDDGSTDGTYEALLALSGGYRRVTVLKMRSPAGESSALEAGMKYSSGETIVFLATRVRANPEGIPRLLEMLNAGKNLVIGWRFPRRDAVLNRLASSFFNRLAGRVYMKVKLHDINSGVFVTARSVLEKIAFYGDRYNFIPLLAAQQGYSVAEEKIEQMPGKFRKSIYLGEYLQRLLDILSVLFLSRYSKKPIHFLGFFGTVFILAGLVIEGYLFIYRILGMGPIAGRPLLLLGALLLVIGIQMISIGLLGEMIIFTHASEIEEYDIESVITGKGVQKRGK